MQESDCVIDEHTLAAFLAGILPEDQRQRVIEHLATNSDAREVLNMAAEALEIARSGEPVEPQPPRVRPAAVLRRSTGPERRMRPTWLNGVGRYAAATLFVFAVGIVLRLTFGPTTDALRSPLQRSGSQLNVEISVSGPTFTWPSVENAYRYRLIFWDPQQARVAGRYETFDSRLGSKHKIVQELRVDLKSGITYMLRVDAIDAKNRIVASSETVEFMLE